MEIYDLEKDILNDYDLDEAMKSKSKKYILINIIKIIFIMSISILVSFLLRKFDLNEATIILVYILGVLFVASTTDGYLYGIGASIVSVLSFNFFFTEPYYTFIAYRADYPITFFIMLITAIVTSTLTSKVKKEAMGSLIRENKIKLLYKSNKKLLKASSKKEAVEFSGESLVEILRKSIIISIKDYDDNLGELSIFKLKKDNENDNLDMKTNERVMLYSFTNNKVVGAGTEFFSDINLYCLPIKGQNSILGVIGVILNEENVIKENDKILLESVSTQLALAMEREKLFEKNKKVNLEAEKERLRGNLLRSISHDLRTPLTSILGSASTIIDNDEVLDKEVKKELLKNICEDTIWLIQSFENILSMTRIDEGTLEIRKNIEVVDEIVGESIARVKRFLDNHNIKLYLPDEIVLLNVDGLLIEQVLVNLIQNAIRYTPENSTIEINVKQIKDKVIFEVSDDGNGILEGDIENIFDRFYTTNKSKNLEQRGIGLGLAICQSIINAHDGTIEVFNNSFGGATFRFTIPVRGEV